MGSCVSMGLDSNEAVLIETVLIAKEKRILAAKSKMMREKSAKIVDKTKTYSHSTKINLTSSTYSSLPANHASQCRDSDTLSAQYPELALRAHTSPSSSLRSYALDGSPSPLTTHSQQADKQICRRSARIHDQADMAARPRPHSAAAGPLTQMDTIATASSSSDRSRPKSAMIVPRTLTTSSSWPQQSQAPKGLRESPSSSRPQPAVATARPLAFIVQRPLSVRAMGILSAPRLPSRPASAAAQLCVAADGAIHTTNGRRARPGAPLPLPCRDLVCCPRSKYWTKHVALMSRTKPSYDATWSFCLKRHMIPDAVFVRSGQVASSQNSPLQKRTHSASTRTQSIRRPCAAADGVVSLGGVLMLPPDVALTSTQWVPARPLTLPVRPLSRWSAHSRPHTHT